MTITSKDIASRSVTFPYPPSVNNYRTPIVIKGRARLILSKEGREYQSRVQWLWLQAGHRTLDGRLHVRIVAHAKDRQRRDLDNILKATLDGLVHATAFNDDSQIDELLVLRGEVDKANPRVVVTITPT